jgi:Fic family protein
MLGIILQSLENLLKTQNRTLTTENRIELYKEVIGSNEFSRKDYLQNFKEISQATASRDLKWAVEQNILTKTGDKRLTKYQYK